MASPASPIADLTYRNYDGPLAAATFRWWAIAKMSMRLSIKKKSFWALGVLSAGYFFILGTVFYFVDVLATNPDQQKVFFQRVIWKDQFLDAFSHAQFFLLFLALLIGVGSIANDNRTNALLVYLSKPCTKFDYLFGKWLGIFIPLLCVVAGPALVFFGYCAMSYRQYGVISDDPWLILRLLLLFPVAPAFHASLALGISSLFDQGRTAGVVYAGLYFLSSIFTVAVAAARQISHDTGALMTNAFYMSVDGIQIGLAKIILGSPGSVLLGGPRANRIHPPDVPSAPLFLTIYFGICVLALLVAWSRIRAVEVIGS